MDIFSWIWLVLLLLLLQPVIAQRVLRAGRRGRIARLQRRRKSRVITIIHRQETMAFFGLPLGRFIDVNDAEEVLAAIRETSPDRPLDIVLHTPGGIALAALQIARAARAHPAKVTVIVPHYAMSGGTLIALAADEVIMSAHAVLGPIDPQVNGQPAASILRVVEQKPIAEIDDATLIQADVAKKAIAQLTEAACDLLAHRMDRDTACALADQLTSGRWTHDYPITAGEAARLGLPVSTEMPREVLELMTLFPQPVRRQAGVEYLPGPDGRS